MSELSRLRIQVLVVVILAAVVGGLFVSGLQNQRIPPVQGQCANNLRQLGLAMHMHSDVYGVFPSEALPAEGTECVSFYVSLLPFLEEEDQVQIWRTNPRPVMFFLCPSRRDPNAGPKRDYGYGGTNSPGSAGTSVLDAPVPLSLSRFKGRPEAASYTAVLSHVWMSPDHYQGGDPTDAGWMTLNNRRSCNTNLPDTTPEGSNLAIGSPHRNGNLFAFVDGHVQLIPYAWAGKLAQIWAIDKTEDVVLP